MLRRLLQALTWVGMASIIAFGLMYFLSENRLSVGDPFPIGEISIPTALADIQKGRYLVRVVGKCQICHGPDLAGATLHRESLLYGRVVAPNITAGAGLMVDDYIRALRFGVGRNNRALIFMPSKAYARLSDRELGFMLAYIDGLQPQKTSLPAGYLGPRLRIGVLFGELQLDASSLSPGDVHPLEDIEAVPTVEYGEKLTYAGLCRSCHGERLSGRRVPWMPGTVAPDLTAVKRGKLWTIDTFMVFMRFGRKPSGGYLDASIFKWHNYREMQTVDLESVWIYLKR